MPKISVLHTVIVMLASAYMEVCCYDMEQPEVRRHWLIRRTVDYNQICLQ
jgi:hypothetical protein